MPIVEVPDALKGEGANAALNPAAATAQSSPTAQKKSLSNTPKKAGNEGTTPASAPARPKGGHKKKPEPNLLHDFLRGRPSASRPTASRPQRKSSGMARAEVKMSAVNKLTPPAKVKNRVMEWQKASREAGAPEVFDMKEPTLEEEDDKPVSARSQSAGPKKEVSLPALPTEEKDTPKPSAPPSKSNAATARKPKKASLETSMPPIARGAQMKRVVSDTHWVNKAAKKETKVIKDPIFNLLFNSGAVKKAATPRAAPPKAAVSRTPVAQNLPKDFTETNWANPPVERKMQDWARRSAEASADGQGGGAEAVEGGAYAAAAVDEAPKSTCRSSSKSPAKLEVEVPAGGAGAFKTAETSTSTSNKRAPALTERVSRDDTEKERREKERRAKAAKENPAEPTKKPEKARTRRVRAARPEEIAAALGLPPPGRRSSKQRRTISKKDDSDDRRRLPSYGAGRGNGRDRQLYHGEDDAPYHERDAESYDKPYKYTPRRHGVSPDRFSDDSNSLHTDRGPPRRQPSKTQQRKPCDEATAVTADTLSTLTSDSETTEAPQRKARNETTTSTADTLSSLTSDTESTHSETASIRRDGMKRESKKSLHGKKSLDEIPVGYSAFSVLDLSPAGQPRTRPVKPTRKASLGVPHVLKRVYHESMKIMHETVDPPQVVIKNPPNIESWLNGTTDAFLGDPSKQPPSSLTKPSRPEKPHREGPQSYKASTPIAGSQLKQETPTRTYLKSRGSSRSHDDREARNHPRESSLADTVVPESNATGNAQEPYTGLKRRSATRENSSPFTERKSPRDLRSSQPVRDLNSYADSLSRDSARNSNTRPRSRDSEKGVKNVEPHLVDGRPYPRIAKPTSRRSSKENCDINAKEAPELTRHSRLHRIPSIGSVAKVSRRQDRSGAINPQDSLKSPASGQPSRYVSRRAFEESGLKRRLTKHSDLMSMLSLPDTSVQHGGNIAPARSIRTKRAPIDSCDISLILSEVKADEEKYLRELETLVDGVIPVLLGSVLARSNSVAALRSSTSTDAISSAATQPLVEMGDALTKLKTLHTQIPVDNSDRLTLWLLSAHSAYSEYLNAWRLGFDDIVVHLAPAIKTDDTNNTAVDIHSPDMDSELVQPVGNLLRRPLVRVKFLAKAAKALYAATPSDTREVAKQLWDELREHVRRRVKEENARKQDMLANNIDVSRARDLRTLSPATNPRIDKTRQVKAKDCFGLSLSHTTGQRLACKVEIIVRDSSRDGGGDVLICEVDGQSNQWLLFPPITMSQISARQADLREELIVMVKGYYDGKHWTEVFTLHADHADIADEFLEMLGTNPISPPATHKAEARPTTPVKFMSAMMSGGLQEPIMDYPIGEPAPKRANGLKRDSAARRENSMATDHVYDKEISAARAQRPGHNGRSYSQMTSQPPGVVIEPQSRDSQLSHELRTPSKRRPSSPLKKEYNPQDQSQPLELYTSTDSYDSYSESDLTDSEDEDEILNRPVEESYPTQKSLRLATSPPAERYCHKFAAYLTCWNNKIGAYENLNKDICSIRVTPGGVKIMIMDASHSSPYMPDNEDTNQPLIELELNPTHVLAQRTGLDVEIRGELLETSLLKPPFLSRLSSVPLLGLRSADTMACRSLYRALEQARKDNAKWNIAEQERIVDGYGQQMQEETAEEFQGRRSWFGRKKSYRASARAPTVDSAGSRFSFGKVSTALDRLKTNNHNFDIEKSSMKSGGIFGRVGNSRASSQYNGDTLSNGFISTGASHDLSQATTGTIDTTQFDTTFMKIRLYMWHTRVGKWVDMGECQITISLPPDWMRETSKLHNGYQKRVTLTEILEERAVDKINKHFSNVLGGVDERVPEVKFDQVVGARCCAKTGLKGIVMQIWEELRGANGELGQAPALGGVCGRHQKYLLQSQSTSQARFIFAKLGAGGGAAQDL